ncbi:MAG: MFS transporter [Terriglobia bacterium]|jgi:fucose permease
MKRSNYLVGLVFATFFVISLLSNILGPIIPDIIESFHVSMAAAALLPFSFFIAYGVLSIPTGFLVELWGEKWVMLVSFAVALVGSLFFALLPVYHVSLVSLFLIGGSMAALQVAINPLLRVAGGEEHFAFNAAFAQLIFGSASFVSPQLYSYVVLHLGDQPNKKNFLLLILKRLVPASLPWVSMYWIFSGVIILMLLTLSASRFPQVKRTEEEQAGAVSMYGHLLKRPIVLLFFISVFMYVGSEQGTADWISQFLAQYHGYDPHTTGATVVAWFWGLLTAGCGLGMLFLKLLDSRKVLLGFSLGALTSLTVALFGSGTAAKLAFPLTGLFASVMWPIIISLALNSLAEHHGPFAGILCTGIMGGAVVPLIIGRLGDSFGLRAGMAFLYFTFGWVLCVSFWAKPLIANQTIGNDKASQASP